MLIEQLFDPGLGHASYLCADPDAGVAFVVDPGRDVERYFGAASRLGVLITHSFETHVHNDYLSGSRALSELRPIQVIAPRGAALAYPHWAVGDGDRIRVGELEVLAVATPGHTPEHTSWLVADLRRADEPQYLFSGGALLVGNIARVDLLGAESERQLSEDAFTTLRERVLPLPDHLAVFPTHGGGGSCSGAVAGSRWTTLGFERKHNPVVRAAGGSLAEFRRVIAHELPSAPAYYPRVRARNREGVPPAALAPLRQLDDRTLDAASAVLIDPRPPHVFAQRHRPRSLNVVGNESFASRVGATVPYGASVAILTDDAEQAERLRRQLADIGYDDVIGYGSPVPREGDTARIEQLQPQDVPARSAAGDLVLDVREASEWTSGRIAGAVHIPYPELHARMGELPRDRALVTYCASGVRSSLAASMLAADGREVRDVRGGFTAWRRAGLPIET